MLRILESQAPAKQTATDTINTLSGRLSTATLLEDRRAAILGLRSFAKQFPASVASGALRDLTSALRRDGEDSDTTKVVLETLLMLFEPDETSPEASEEITLWIADEITQRQDNVTALLDLLDTGEFYLRLYSLQILSHVTGHRPQRAQEVVLAAPLGVSRIAAVLDDKREAVRNEALLLLAALTPSNAELQKVVAFENAFDRGLAIIESEGGLTHGSTTVQDCLSLFANLLTLNTSNQSLFREMGCIAKVAKLLADVIQEEESSAGVSDWLRQQRDINLWGLLRVIQLFLVYGSQGTSLSQTAFWQNRVLLRILQIAFHPSFSTNVRAKSLDVCGDVIRQNQTLQEQFGDLSVQLPQSHTPAANGHATPNSVRSPVDGRSSTATPVATQPANVIEALLGLTLEPASPSLFDVRLAASKCIQAFIEGHAGIRSHVLRRAMEGHHSGDDTIPNLLTVLLEPAGIRSNSDPYQVWMASVLLLHILCDDPATKSMALTVAEGNAEEGEEVVTFVQTLTSNVVAGVQHVEDERALLGYLMLLCIWLYEDPEAVNDFLGEASNINGLAAAVKVSSSTMPLVAGLCCLLLGIIYEFSTKDSPVPRATLQSVFNKSLGREVYIDRMSKLRESPFIRDFEIMATGTEGILPDVYFDGTFVNFFKDNYSRLLRGIDRDPNMEAAFLSNGVQKGISRELVDTLRADLEEQKRQVEDAGSELVQLRQKLEMEEMEHRRSRESAAMQLERIKQINDSLHRNHEEEVGQLQGEHQQQMELLSRRHEETLAQLRREHLTAIEEISSKHLAEKHYFEQRTAGHEREMKRVQEKLTKQHSEEIEQATSQAMREQQRLRGEIQSLQSQIEELKSHLSRQSDEHQQILSNVQRDHDHKLTESNSRATQAAETAQAKIKAAETISADLTSEIRELQTKLAALEGSAAASTASVERANTRATSAEESSKSLAESLKLADRKYDKVVLEMKSLQSELETTTQQLQQAQTENVKRNAEIASVNGSAKLNETPKSASLGSVDSESDISTLKSQAAKAKEIQTELDDLLVVFADLEAKRAVDKKRLKDLGEDVSEDEDDDDDDDDEAGEDEKEEEDIDDDDEDEGVD